MAPRPHSRAGTRWAALLLALALLGTAGCERQPPAAGQLPASGAASAATAPAADAPVILCLGDSLTAGFGLPEEQSYPALLQARLDARGYRYRVVNAGVSGDTSAGGLARMDWLLRTFPDIVIVALGGNDGLRGLSPAALKENLARIIERARGVGARVVLAGMRMPANLGADYTRRFAAVYPVLAREYDVPLIPFLLEGVAADPALNQLDMIHPNAKGTRIVMENVWRVLEPLLEK